MEQKLKERVKIDQNGCWIWQRQIHPSGYAKWKVYDTATKKQNSVWAHRLSYEVFVGPIPEGLTIDHLCFTKPCINPSHMEVVTQSVNSLRGNENYRLNIKKTYPCGHLRGVDDIEFTKRSRHGNNTLYKIRRCRPCWKTTQRDYQRKYREKKRATANGIH